MMKKVLPFLEKNVQWIALGLGAIYLGYMIWIYAVQTPVLVTSIAPTPLTPGEVDQHILDTVALPLDRVMKDTNVPEMVVPNFIDRFKADMDFSDFATYALTIIPDSPVQQIQLTPTRALVYKPDAPINALPTLPAAVFVDSSSGKSNVQPFVAAAAGGGAPPAGNNPVQPVAGSQDKSWVTVSYTISPSAMAKAFAAANIPAFTEKTTILDVQLWREEAQPGGKWSDPVLIKPINSDALLPYPPAQDNLQQQTYLAWAKLHVSDILQPGFYVVNKGDLWHAPGQIVAVVAPVALPPLDPTQDYPPNVVAQYPDDQRHAYFQAHYKFKQSQPRGSRRNAPPPSAPPVDSPPSSRINRATGAIGTDTFSDVIPPGGTPLPSANGPGVPSAQAGPPPALGPDGQPIAPDLATQFPIPPGEFDPNSIPTDITGWAHDDTVVSGHTYRYMITYRIKNPIEGTNAAKNNPKLTQIFDIQSRPGLWSKPVNVASTTNFFVYANSRPGSGSARIKVYKWQNGVERSHVFEVSPGDIIGGKDADADYNTGWTVVDLRFDDPKNPDSMTVIVMDPNGILDRRDYRTDQAKPELKALDQQVSSASVADQLAGGK